MNRYRRIRDPIAFKTTRQLPEHLPSPNACSDDTNVRLLGELHANPRITMSALGRRVGMSPPAVTERVQRLEQAGVILGYRLEVDPAALGLPVTAFVRIRPAPAQLPKIAELAAGSARSASATGSPAKTASWSRCSCRLACPIWKNSSISSSLYGQTVSSIVVSTPVPPRPLPLRGKDMQDRATPTAGRSSPASSSADSAPHELV